MLFLIGVGVIFTVEFNNTLFRFIRADRTVKDNAQDGAKNREAFAPNRDVALRHNYTLLYTHVREMSTPLRDILDKGKQLIKSIF